MKRLAYLACCLYLLPLMAAQAADDLDARLQAVEQRYREEGPEPVLADFEALLAEAEATNDVITAATAQRFVGECHWLMGDFEAARSALDRAVAQAKALGDPALEGKAHNVLGLLAWDEGDYGAATAAFGAAATLAEQAGDAKMQGAVLNNQSLVLDELGDYRSSLEQYNKVLDLYAQVDFPRGEGDTLGNIGGVYLLLGRYREAVEQYTRALEISESLDSAQAMSQDHGNLGFAYAGLGETQTALAHFDRALELAREAGLAQEEAYWLRGKANAEIAAGRYDLGLQHHREALALFETAGAEGPLLDALHDFGQLMLELGDPVSAQQSFEQALAQARALQRPRSESLNEIALGNLFLRREQFSDAEELFTRAMSRAREAGEIDLEAGALLSLSQLQRERGDADAARKLARQALQVAEALPRFSAAAWLSLGEAENAASRHTEAMAAYAEAGKLANQLGDPDLLWQVADGRAKALESDGDRTGAVAALESAIGHIEGVRARLREKRFRSGYLQDKREVYTRLVRLQLELGRDKEAFETAERLRSYGFSEPTRPVTVDEVPQLAELRARIRQLQRAIDEERTIAPVEQRQLALDTFSAELLVAQQQFETLLDDMAALQPATAVATGADATRSRLREGEALLEFVVGSDHVMLFGLTSDRLHTALVPMTQDTLHGRVELLRDLLLEPDNQRWALPATRLSEALLQPALGWLEGVQRLYLVPHGVLNYLPFAALPGADDAPLVQSFDLAFLPSASALAPSLTPAQGETVLTVAPARSRLQHAPEEARAIATLFEPRARSLQGAEATESAFRDLAADYGVLHLATHGFFNKLNPMLSGLELEADADHDGLLEVHEILGLQLNASLVTLSACKTGLGSGFFNEFPAGDDFVGLTRAFLQAGSSAVLATLWEVDDRSTVDLMKDFYTHLEEAGADGDKAVALARAQRALLASEPYRHPYYWAPFVLVGAQATTPMTET